LLIKWVETYGNVSKFNGTLNTPSVLVADPKIVQEIAVTRAYDFIKPIHIMSNLKSFLGDGLFFAEGGSHKRQKKMMNPAFAHNNIKVIIFN
jgi:cytochrome P450